MSEINVVARTQKIIVDPASRSVSVINAGPMGPGGPPAAPVYVAQPEPPLDTDILWLDTDDETSGFDGYAALTGAVFTGKIDINTTYPAVDLVSPGAPADEKTWRLVSAPDGKLYLQAYNDALSAAITPVTFDRTGATEATITVSNETNLVVPDANADGEALAYDQHGARVKSLRVEDVWPILTFYETDGIVNGRRVDLVQNNGWFSMRRGDDNGAAPWGGIAINMVTGAIEIAAPTLKIPAATAVNHAAQVTAINTDTGRYAIGGREIGETGWRDISGLLINGWTGSLLVNRTGNVVSFRAMPINGSAKSNDRLINDILGFRMHQAIGHLPIGQGVTAGIPMIEVSGGFQIASASASIYFTTSFTTQDAWPTTLPGVAA